MGWRVGGVAWLLGDVWNGSGGRWVSCVDVKYVWVLSGEQTLGRGCVAGSCGFLWEMARVLLSRAAVAIRRFQR